MKVEINGEVYIIGWQHRRYSCDFRFNELPSETVCTIKRQDIRGYIVARGVAHCSKKDNFCKETGRKVSLTRAIEQIVRMNHVPVFKDKETRRKVWETYFNRKGEKNASKESVCSNSSACGTRG